MLQCISTWSWQLDWQHNTFIHHAHGTCIYACGAIAGLTLAAPPFHGALQRGVVTVQLRSFNVTTVGRGELQLGGTLYTSVTTLNFVGNLTMKVLVALVSVTLLACLTRQCGAQALAPPCDALQTNLACPTYCGDAGRCYKMSHNTTTCRCDCGWNSKLLCSATPEAAAAAQCPTDPPRAHCLVTSRCAGDLRTGACTLATGYCDPRMRPN